MDAGPSSQRADARETKMTASDESNVSEKQTPNETPSDSNEASDQSTLTLWEEFCFLILHEKRWWMVPLLVALTMIVLAVAVSQSTTVPFIYRLF